jgi:hypothetical protein
MTHYRSKNIQDIIHLGPEVAGLKVKDMLIDSKLK